MVVVPLVAANLQPLPECVFEKSTQTSKVIFYFILNKREAIATHTSHPVCFAHKAYTVYLYPYYSTTFIFWRDTRHLGREECVCVSGRLFFGVSFFIVIFFCVHATEFQPNWLNRSHLRMTWFPFYAACWCWARETLFISLFNMQQKEMTLNKRVWLQRSAATVLIYFVFHLSSSSFIHSCCAICCSASIFKVRCCPTHQVFRKIWYYFGWKRLLFTEFPTTYWLSADFVWILCS